MPLSMHANAMRAAQAALRAGHQGQFRGMHDRLFGGSARNLPMDAAVFKSCLDGGKHIPDVLKDTQDTAALQVNGTPSFPIGRTTVEGVEGPILIGAQRLPEDRQVHVSVCVYHRFRTDDFGPGNRR